MIIIYKRNMFIVQVSLTIIIYNHNMFIVQATGPGFEPPNLTSRVDCSTTALPTAEICCKMFHKKTF